MSITYVAQQRVTYPEGWTGPWNSLQAATTVQGARDVIGDNKLELVQVGGFEKHTFEYRIVRREETVVEEDCD